MYVILQTNGTNLSLRCEGRTEVSMQIRPGVHRISLQYPCSLHGNEWRIVSTFQQFCNEILYARTSDFYLGVTTDDLLVNIYFRFSIDYQ